MIQLQSITKERFKDFGVLIEHPESSKEPFNIIISEDVEPWRIATYKISDKEAVRLEAHPYSLESFEPLTGVGLLLVAKPESSHEVSAFVVDQPVCLYKGVWHQLLALTDDVCVKIMENFDVTSEFHYFDEPLKVGLY